MNTDQVPNLAADSTAARWSIEWWGLVRGLFLLFSAFAAVTVLYYIVLTVFSG